MNHDPADDARRRRALELRERHYKELASYAITLRCSVAEAQQVANDSLAELAIHEFEHAAERITNARAWLYAAAWRKAKEVIRNRPHHVRLEDVAHERLADPGLDPAKHAELMDVLDVVRTLPEEYRIPLVLSIFGFPVAEIAQVIGSSPEAAKQRVCRARKTIRSKLGMDPSPSTSASTTVRTE